MRAELLIRRQQFSGSSSPTDPRSVGLAQGKTEQITCAALHLQIWNIKQNKKIMFSPFLCKSDISARLPADHRYLPGLLLRQQPQPPPPPPPPLSHRLFIICYQQTSEPPPKKLHRLCWEPTAGSCHASNLSARGPISWLHLQGWTAPHSKQFFSVLLNRDRISSRI